MTFDSPTSQRSPLVLSSEVMRSASDAVASSIFDHKGVVVQLPAETSLSGRANWTMGGFQALRVVDGDVDFQLPALGRGLSAQGLDLAVEAVAGDLADFPILVKLNVDPELAAQAQADGDDILFASSDGTTKLAHEVEYYDSATGELRAWVKTDLSGTSDTRIFMYYGNDTAVNQQNVAGVWDTNFVGVYHLSETPTGAAGEIKDSTSNANHAATFC